MSEQKTLLPPEEFLNETSLHWLHQGGKNIFNIFPFLWNPGLKQWTEVNDDRTYSRVVDTTGWKWIAHIPFPSLHECLTALNVSSTL